jgi:hypothetical protein
MLPGLWRTLKQGFLKVASRTLEGTKTAKLIDVQQQNWISNCVDSPDHWKVN